MVELRIRLKDIYLDLKHDNNLAALPEEQAILELANAYSFLGKPLAVVIDNDEAVITAQVGKPQLAGKAAKAVSTGQPLPDAITEVTALLEAGEQTYRASAAVRL